MTMRKLLWSLLLLTACSRGAPDDVLLISGEVEGEAAADITLERRLSLICFGEQPGGGEEEPFQELERLQPGTDGRYAFELYRATAHPTSEERACFRLRSEAHPRSELRTQLHDADARLPTLTSWDLAPSLTDGAWQAPVAPVLPEGNLSTYHAQEWQLDTASGAAWRVFGAAPFVPTPELFEDFGALVLGQQARAQVLDRDQSLGVLFATQSVADLTLRSLPVALDAPPVIPVSRDAECWVDDQRWEACPWVDGLLAPVAPAGSSSVQEVELRWAQATEVRALVVRGLELAGPQVRVELAEGEGPWVEVPSLEAPELGNEDWGPRTLATPGLWEQLNFAPIRADRVRLTVEHGGIYGLRELSLFE